MLANVIDLCERLDLRLVHVSGLNVFSGYASSEPIVARPDLALRPRGVYAEAKCRCEQLVQAHRARGLRASVVRPGAIYGPGMPPGSLVARLFDAAAEEAAAAPRAYLLQYSQQELVDAVLSAARALAAGEEVAAERTLDVRLPVLEGAARGS